MMGSARQPNSMQLALRLRGSSTEPRQRSGHVKSGGVNSLLVIDLGSVRLVVNSATGGVIQQVDYADDAFGKIINGSPPFGLFGYGGGIHDIHGHFVRFGLRDYDTHVGRWTAKIPLASGRDANLYGYVHNGAVLIDPSSLSLCSAHQAIHSGRGQRRWSIRPRMRLLAQAERTRSTIDLINTISTHAFRIRELISL
jgi:RHS repeat-associated protein